MSSEVSSDYVELEAEFDDNEESDEVVVVPRRRAAPAKAAGRVAKPARPSLPVKLKVKLPRKAVESEDEEDETSEEDETTATPPPRLTERQKIPAGHMELPMVKTRTPVPSTLTEEELQFKKEETVRRRRNQTEKKLEEEKTETLNKLLKRRADKVRDLKDLGGDEDAPSATFKPRRPMAASPAFWRWTSAKEGETLSYTP